MLLKVLGKLYLGSARALLGLCLGSATVLDLPSGRFRQWGSAWALLGSDWALLGLCLGSAWALLGLCFGSAWVT